MSLEGELPALSAVVSSRPAATKVALKAVVVCRAGGAKGGCCASGSLSPDPSRQVLFLLQRFWRCVAAGWPLGLQLWLLAVDLLGRLGVLLLPFRVGTCCSLLPWMVWLDCMNEYKTPAVA